MAHFAKLNENNEVIEILVIHNNEVTDQNGDEVEELGIDFLKSIYGETTNWKQTSYNSNIRGTFAEIGGIYKEDEDRFVPSSPFPSWVLNEDETEWVPPTNKPTEDEHGWGWNESLYNETGDGWEELYTYPEWIQNRIWVWNIDLQYFEAIQPYPSWSLNENGLWKAPVDYPESGDWDWSEQNLNWVEYTP